ncbi:type III-B CRISPR module RAMP protein Cmr6 [Archangium violaceum]|uniref:type III-B CRISPR module RAMP protein Cmr6 n=1 Tax=Archangium violaceum TaxID=83451 RepID=UPI0019512411|nr:type III-B CRISPR module RAMP protein Cmr6 [Archangium violaceum]QRN96596.1 type III-B CRISPR module RAMP protein Cmr6 [Archangium violaceum]
MWLMADGEDRCPETPGQVPSHAGLGYTRCAPLAVLQEDPAARKRWLELLTQCREPARYSQAYRRWKESFQGPDTLCFIVRAESRVLVGHGTSSATGVGLTLHHTWGVPVLPGSALKGLTAHYVQTVYGPEPGIEDPEREPFRGTTWEFSRPSRAPGRVFRRLFGSPDVDELSEKGSQGEVVFHDALWVPAEMGSGPMLARDVLTVHQRAYYESGGREWPVDFDDPNPVSFLTVAPGNRFLVVLEARGERALLERAGRYVREALESWGLGGKTAAGYGRLVSETPSLQSSRILETPALMELKTWLEEQKARNVGQRQQFQQVEQQWAKRLLALSMPERHEAIRLFRKFLNLKRGDEQQRFEELLTRLRA